MASSQTTFCFEYARGSELVRVNRREQPPEDFLLLLADALERHILGNADFGCWTGTAEELREIARLLTAERSVYSESGQNLEGSQRF